MARNVSSARIYGFLVYNIGQYLFFILKKCAFDVFERFAVVFSIRSYSVNIRSFIQYENVFRVSRGTAHFKFERCLKVLCVVFVSAHALGYIENLFYLNINLGKNTIFLHTQKK